MSVATLMMLEKWCLGVRLDPPQSQHHVVVEHIDHAAMTETTVQYLREIGATREQIITALGRNRAGLVSS